MSRSGIPHLYVKEAVLIANAVIQCGKQSSVLFSASDDRKRYTPYYGNSRAAGIRARKLAVPAYKQWIFSREMPYHAARYLLNEGDKNVLIELELYDLALASVARGCEKPSITNPSTAGGSGTPTSPRGSAACGGTVTAAPDFSVPTGDEIVGGGEDDMLYGGEDSSSSDEEADDFAFHSDENDDEDDGDCEWDQFIGVKPRVKKRTFPEVLRGWAVKYGVSKAALTGLIGLLLIYRPTIEYAELGRIKTGRKLLKVDKKDVEAVLFRDLEDYDGILGKYKTNKPTPISDLVDEDDGADDDLFRVQDEVGAKKHHLNKGHRYIHLGIENAVLGRSCGLIYRDLFLENLRLIDNLDQGLLTDDFNQLINGDLEGAKKGLHYLQHGKLAEIAEQERRKAKREVLFVIDVNIDGVQLFKNSTSAQAYPILGRVYAIGRRKIPIKRSPPFLIGMYHGPGKMPLDAFLFDFVEELKALDPRNKTNIDRKCAVALRLMICDAPMRATLKGIVGHSGYWSCERCRTRGLKIGKSAMMFPSVHCGHRSDEHWEDYLTKEDCERNPELTHRRRDKTSIFQTLRFPMIHGFSLDSMHTIDGGVILRAFHWLFGLGKKMPRKVPEVVTCAGNALIDAWSKCTPYEFARRPRNLRSLGKWKMIEGRTFLMHLACPLFTCLGGVVKPQFNLIKRLIRGIRLIGGFHLDAIPEADILKAEKDFVAYLTDMTKAYGNGFATFKNHALIHVPQDTRNHRCPMDSMSAYSFENLQKLFVNMLRSGKGVLVQIVHGLLAYRKFHIPEEELTAGDRGETFEELLLKVRANRGNLQLPALQMRKGGFIHGSRMRKVLCEGFVFNNKFPNNVVALNAIRGERLKIGVITEIFEEYKTMPGRRIIMITVREFSIVSVGFNDVYDSTDIGYYRVKRLMDVETKYCFSDIRGKFYAVHGDIKDERDPIKAKDTQEWHLTLIHHSDK